MMVAEKSADLILGNTLLPAEKVPYYRYRDNMPLHPTSPVKTRKEKAHRDEVQR